MLRESKPVQRLICILYKYANSKLRVLFNIKLVLSELVLTHVQLREDTYLHNSVSWPCCVGVIFVQAQYNMTLTKKEVKGCS